MENELQDLRAEARDKQKAIAEVPVRDAGVWIRALEWRAEEELASGHILEVKLIGPAGGLRWGVKE